MSSATPIHERIVGGGVALLLSILSILLIESALASEPLHDPTLHDPTQPPAAALAVDDTVQKANAGSTDGTLAITVVGGISPVGSRSLL